MSEPLTGTHREQIMFMLFSTAKIRKKFKSTKSEGEFAPAWHMASCTKQLNLMPVPLYQCHDCNAVSVNVSDSLNFFSQTVQAACDVAERIGK